MWMRNGIISLNRIIGREDGKNGRRDMDGASMHRCWRHILFLHVVGKQTKRVNDKSTYPFATIPKLQVEYGEMK